MLVPEIEVKYKIKIKFPLTSVLHKEQVLQNPEVNGPQ